MTHLELKGFGVFSNIPKGCKEFNDIVDIEIGIVNQQESNIYNLSIISLKTLSYLGSVDFSS